MDSFSKKKGGRCVPEIVEAEARQTCPFAQREA